MRWKKTNKHPKKTDCPCRILGVGENNVAEMFDVDYPTDTDRKAAICIADIYPWKEFVKKYKIIKWEYEEKLQKFVSKKLKVNYIHFD